MGRRCHAFQSLSMRPLLLEPDLSLAQNKKIECPRTPLLAIT